MSALDPARQEGFDAQSARLQPGAPVQMEATPGAAPTTDTTAPATDPAATTGTAAPDQGTADPVTATTEGAAAAPTTQGAAAAPTTQSADGAAAAPTTEGGAATPTTQGAAAAPTTEGAAAAPKTEGAGATPPADPAAEREVVRAAYAAGTKGISNLTNLVFFNRHPERVHGAVKDPIRADEPALGKEWNELRATVVKPVVDEEVAKAAPVVAQADKAASDAKADPAATGGAAGAPAADQAAAAPAASTDEIQAIIAPFATYVPFTKTIASLDEDGLGAELARTHALSSPQKTRMVFDALSAVDRDDVAFALASALTDAQLASLDAALKSYLAEQLTGGYAGAAEAVQAARLTGGGAPAQGTTGGTTAAGGAADAKTADPAATAGSTATPAPTTGTTSAELGATTAGGATLGGQSSAEVRVGTVMTVVDANALRRDPANLRKTMAGQLLPQGMKVVVVKAVGTYVQLISAPGETTVITDADNAWTAGGNLGGTGSDVGLGNERSDDGAATTADGIKAGLPTGRNPGKSPYKWKFGAGFATSLNGISLKPTLLQKVTRLLEWAVQNDMLAGDVELGSGMRSPADAHRLCVSWEIQFGKRVSLDALKALPGGNDSDGNHWYEEGWDWAAIKTNANKNAKRTADATASEGYASNDKRRLPVDTTRDVSRHCSGGALDVTIPWRAKGKDASTNAQDVWAWEEINKQFGLYRAVSSECWHLQETGLALEQDRKPEAGPNG